MNEQEVRRVAHEEAIKAAQNILAVNACTQLAGIFYTLPLEAVKGHLGHFLTVELRQAVYDDERFRELLNHVIVTSEQILAATEIK